MTAPPDGKASRRARSSWRRLRDAVTVALLAFLVGGCGIYDEVVQDRAVAWDRRQVFDENGVREGFQPYELGEGRTALLLVHGFADTPEVWRPMATEFAGRGYRCRAVRLPGFGDRLELRRQRGLDDWTATVAREAEDLLQDADRLWIIGHSLGAAVAIRATLDGAVDPEGLVLLAPLVQVGDERSPLLAPHQWFDLLHRHIELTETTYPPDIIRPLPPDYPDEERFIPGNLHHALFELLEANRGRAGEVDVPLFMAVSPHDRVADEVAAEDWFDQAVNAPRKVLLRCVNSGHVLPRDRDAERLTDAIVGFVRTQDRSPDRNQAPGRAGR